MTSNHRRKASKERRRFLAPEVQREHLRRQVADLYRADSRYQLIVLQDLKTLWSKAWVGEGFSPHPDWNNLQTILETPESAAERRQLLSVPALTDYVDAVRRTSSTSLRLSLNGKPADWASAFLHADVATRDPFMARSVDDVVLEVPILPDQDLSIVLTVWPTFAKVEMVDDGEPSMLEVGTEWVPGSNTFRPIVVSALEEDLTGNTVSGHSAETWEELEAAATQLLHEGIRALREQFELTSSGRNPSSLEAQLETLKQLFRYLFHREMDFHLTSNEGKAIRERWRKLSQVLEIDIPHFPK